MIVDGEVLPDAISTFRSIRDARLPIHQPITAAHVYQVDVFVYINEPKEDYRQTVIIAATEILRRKLGLDDSVKFVVEICEPSMKPWNRPLGTIVEPWHRPLGTIVLMYWCDPQLPA